MDKKEPTKLNTKNASLPNLNKTNESQHLKSLGQASLEKTISDDDQTNASTTLRSRSRNFTSTLESNTSKLKTTTGYESSSESSEDRKSKNSLELALDTLTGTRQNETDSKSITSVSSHSNVQPKSSLKKDVSEKTLADRIKESNLQKQKKSSQAAVEQLFKTNSTTNQSVVTFREPESEILQKNDKIHEKKVKDLINENNLLKQKIELLEKQALEREEKFKIENDALIIKLHDNLAKDMKSEEDKQELIKVLVSKQQERNEKLINEQNKVIKSLENELKMAKSYQNCN